jgi:hypothetical protein
VSIADCRIIDLPRISDPRGNLTFIEGERHIPFAIRRVFYLYDVPDGGDRAALANTDLEQLIIAANGSFDIIVNDGSDRLTFSLNRSYYGLYVPRMIWPRITNFSSGSVCLIIASDYYDTEPHRRDHDEVHLAVRTAVGPVSHIPSSIRP